MHYVVYNDRIALKTAPSIITHFHNNFAIQQKISKKKEILCIRKRVSLLHKLLCVS